MTYFQYIKKNTRPFMIVVVVLFILFYIAGFWMEVDSMVEGKYLLLILGIPAVLFFGGMYYKWRKLR